MPTTKTKTKTKLITFANLVNNKRYATILANLIEGKISKEEFLSKEIYTSIKKSILLGSFEEENDDLKQISSKFLEVLKIKDKDSLKKFTDSVNDEYFRENATVENALITFLKSVIGTDFATHKDSRLFKPQKFLTKLLGDKEFIEQVEKDKKHIVSFQKFLQEIPSNFKRFVNIGWWDDTYLNGDYNALKKLLDNALKDCDKWIEEEKNGLNLASVDSECISISGSTGQSDSWEEWKYIFPNTYKYLYDV